MMRDAATRRFDLIVFDWDGTLVDSTTLIAESLQQACRDLGVAVPDDAAARYVIGLGLTDAMKSVVRSCLRTGMRNLARAIANTTSRAKAASRYLPARARCSPTSIRPAT